MITKTVHIRTGSAFERMWRYLCNDKRVFTGLLPITNNQTKKPVIEEDITRLKTSHHIYGGDTGLYIALNTVTVYHLNLHSHRQRADGIEDMHINRILSMSLTI